MMRVESSPRISLVAALLVFVGCHAESNRAQAPAETRADAPPAVRVETDEHSAKVDSPARAPIAGLDALAAAAAEQFRGRLDLDSGVLVVDIYDDDGEVAKPIEAARLCGPELEARAAVWASDLRGHLEDPGGLLERFPHYARCEDERCWHEAFEAGDHRGLYRFEDGTLREVAWTSGPPGHIGSPWLDAEDRFVTQAFAALRDAPCGATHEGTLELTSDE